MRNAVIYIRTKTDLSEESLKAVSVQAQQCKAYSDANGINVVGIYTDINIFGTKQRFVGWKAIINNPDPFYDSVLISDYSRTGRNIRSVRADIQKLTSRGVNIISTANAMQNQMQLTEIFKL